MGLFIFFSCALGRNLSLQELYTFSVYLKLKFLIHIEKLFSSCTKYFIFFSCALGRNLSLQELYTFSVYLKLKFLIHIEKLFSSCTKYFIFFSCALGRNRTCNYSLGRNCYIHLTTRAL